MHHLDVSHRLQLDQPRTQGDRSGESVVLDHWPPVARALDLNQVLVIDAVGVVYLTPNWRSEATSQKKSSL